MKRVFFTFALLLSLLVSQSDSTASIEVVEFDTASQEQRYRDLIAELRCLVCQNQNLAGSDAPLAKDLREIAATMIKQGDSDADIKKFMRSRYGDFVLYEPPFNWSTAFLWLGPFILLMIVVIGLVLNIRRRQQEELFTPTHATNDAEQVKVRNLMRDTPSLKPEDSEKPKR
ncbi:MAG: cytochrome c-type biogenesis protein CcmH [Arenicella sp.]|nr:cytochrome c-type biogenesis protein CcmH [Arenicella sp.]